ncbi:hypothetical protein ABW20_dc0108120 [Dactylellina cionopaga]|nr:hypothetical protein ABW20_dc0108120 [Dactylellina cionopaga]
MTYKGHELDSVLTEPVVDIVCTCYCELVERNSDQIKAYLNEKIAGNKIVLQEVLKIVMGELSSRGLKVTQTHLAHLIHEAASQAAQNAAHSQLGITIGHGVAVAAGTTAGQMLAGMLVKAIAHHITTVASHTAGKTLITVLTKAAAKKIAIVAITGVVVNILATKFDVASAATALHAIGWVFLGGYLSIKLIGLPEEMAEKVADGVRDTLNDTYQSCLTGILDKLAKSAQDPKEIAVLVLSQVTDSDMEEFQRNIEGVNLDVSDPKFLQLEKDAHKEVESVWGWISRWSRYQKSK